jgi:hypothetical protein
MSGGCTLTAPIRLHCVDTDTLFTYAVSSEVRVVKSRRMRWAGHMARMGEGRGVHRVLVGKPEGTKSLARPRRSWKDIL